MSVVPFRWRNNQLDVLDQRQLPHEIKTISCRTPKEVAEVIRSMAVRGAPAIGCVAAYGMVLGTNALEESASLLKAARPTAVNLAWAVDRMMRVAQEWTKRNGTSLAEDLIKEAKRIESEDVTVNEAIGRQGAGLFRKNAVILTHCNTGALATAGIGTALGVIRFAHKQGKVKKVFVDETRPYLQGARLTTWELEQEGIPYELITDSMAAFFMKTEKVDGVIVGCDRVAVNGDTANKIGTYGLAVLAHYHKVPFYVAMPTSTLDLKIKSGEEIPIEERSSAEVVQVGPVRIAPQNTKARHPAFDVTPASLITAIISEHGIAKPPYRQSLRRLGK